MDSVVSLLESVVFWVAIIILFGGGGVLYAPIRRFLDQRHARQMKELEVRQLEAEAKLAEHRRTKDMPSYMDREDPREVEAWERAQDEMNRTAAKAAAAKRVV